jgi:hypothetical protein
LGAYVLRQVFAMERYHLDLYFHDLDPEHYTQYGQTIYSLNVHYEALKNGGGLAASAALYLSMAALVLFNGLLLGAALYSLWPALNAAINLPLAVSAALGLIALQGLAWYLSERTIREKRRQSQALLKHAKANQSHT